MTTKKLIIKQIILLVLALLACLLLSSIEVGLVFGYYVFGIDTIYEMLSYILFAIIIIFYAPLACLYFMRIRRRQNTENLYKFFRAVNWFAIILSIGFFFLCIYNLIHPSLMDEGLLWRGDLINYLKGLLFSLPLIIVALLFFWTNKANKLLISQKR